MTTLKDLPQGTLLISGNGDKGLYSNDNAPIFIMKLGETKAEVLWQGTSRYDAFMKPLIAKQQNGTLEENRDYILPENVGMMLPTFGDTTSKTQKVQGNPHEKDYGKFYVNLSTLLPEDYECTLGDRNIYLNTNRGTFVYENWSFTALIVDDNGDETSLAPSDNKNTLDGEYKFEFTQGEYNTLREKANSTSHHDGLPTLPKFDPKNPVFEFVDGKGLEDEPKFKVRLSNTYGWSYLNLDTSSTGHDWGNSCKVSDGYIFPASSSEGSVIKTTFTLSEYNRIKQEVEENVPNDFNSIYSLPEYNPDNSEFELQDSDGDTKEVKPSTSNHGNFHVNLDSLIDEQISETHYLNVLSEDEDNNGWDTWDYSALSKDEKYVAFGSDLTSCNGTYKVTFNQAEYEDIKNNVNESKNNSGLPILPDFDPENPVFEFIGAEEHGSGESIKEDTKESTKATFRVHVPDGTSADFLNVGTGSYDGPKLPDGRTLFLLDSSESDGVVTHFTLDEYNKIKKYTDGLEDWYKLPEYDPNNKQFVLASGDHLPEIEPSTKGKDKEEPKFSVKIVSDEGDCEGYLNKKQGIIPLLDENDVLHLDDSTTLFAGSLEEFPTFTTAFTLAEYNDLRTKSVMNESYYKMSWFLPEYDPDSSRFVLVKGDSLPEAPEKENMGNLPDALLTELEQLREYASEPHNFDKMKKTLDKLVRYMGEQGYGYHFYRDLAELKAKIQDVNDSNLTTKDCSYIYDTVSEISSKVIYNEYVG